MGGLVIIGIGSQARLAKFYFERDSEHEVVAFSVDEKYIDSEDFCGLPVVPLEKIASLYPPEEFSAFVAVGYSGMNSVRADLCEKMTVCGYKLESYVSPKCTFLSEEEIGQNCFILEDNTIQPFVKIGNNVTLWSGNHIGHDVIINDHCFITSHVVISGFTEVGEFSFLGVNSTLRDSIVIGKKCLIGAGACIMKSTEDESVWLPPKSVQLNKKSSELEIS